MPRPDFEKFLTDPKHADDREFMEKFMDHYVAKKKKESEEKSPDGEEKENLFDFMFGGKK